jgi:uncharacterized protein (DUF427 family)
MFRRRIRPRPGQESVWDYPRPPRVEPAPAPVRVVHNSVDLANSERALRVLETAWTYASPKEGFEELVDHIAFYAARVDAAYVGDEKVTPQAGDFYGGWITSNVVGPFKGDPGTLGW